MKILKVFARSQKLRDYVRKNILVKGADCDCNGIIQDQGIQTDDCTCKIDVTLFDVPYDFTTTAEQSVPIDVSVVNDKWERLARTSPLK